MEDNIELKYLYQLKMPFFPAVGDIKLIYDYDSEKDFIKFHALKCVALQKAHAIYEYIGEKTQDNKTKQLAIPFEALDTFGYSNTNYLIKAFMNGLMKQIIEKSTSSSNFLFDPSDLEEYSKSLGHLVIIYRKCLKEANRLNRILIEN